MADPSRALERAIGHLELACRASDDGRADDALTATAEAIELARTLGEPGRTILAMALTHLANCLTESGTGPEQGERALNAGHEACELYRELDAEQPGGFRSELALALTNLGATQGDLERDQAALDSTRQAIEIYRLTTEHTADLARALDNAGTYLSHLDKHEEALTATCEAIQLYRELGSESSDLTRALRDLPHRLRALGRDTEALDAQRDAAQMLRSYTQQDPPRFEAGFADAAAKLGLRYSAAGEVSEAVRWTTDAILARQLLSERGEPELHLPTLARLHANLGVDLSALGRHEEALRATLAAVDLLRELASSDDAGRFDRQLADALGNLAQDLHTLERGEAAVQASWEGVALLRDLAEDAPDEDHGSELATCLGDLGLDLARLGRHDEALRAAGEAVARGRLLVAQDRDYHLPDLVQALDVRAAIEHGQGDHRAAVDSASEGLRLLLPLHQEDPHSHTQLFDELLADLNAACDAGGIDRPEI